MMTQKMLLEKLLKIYNIRDFYEKPEPIDYDDFEALGELYDDSSDFI